MYVVSMILRYYVQGNLHPYRHQYSESMMLKILKQQLLDYLW